MISFVMTGITDPTCSRLVPPVTWLSSPRAKVKVLHSAKLSKQTKMAADVTDYEMRSRKRSFSREKDTSSTADDDDNDINEMINDNKSNDDNIGTSSSSSSIQVVVPREFAENSLRALRMHGFTRQVST